MNNVPNQGFYYQPVMYPYFVPTVPYPSYSYPMYMYNGIGTIVHVPLVAINNTSFMNTSTTNQSESDPPQNEENKTQPSDKPVVLGSDSPKPNIRCSCEKTRCLKLYCDCLKAGQECGSFCTCKDCLNRKTFQERDNALEFLKKKNSQAFARLSQKLEGNETNSERIGCSCQRTHCLKRYCSCYLKGVKCSSLCTCIGCENKWSIC